MVREDHGVVVANKVEGLGRHIEKHKNCFLCPIGSRHKVFVRLGPSSPIKYLFIGEAPGVSDSVIGKPFIGASGKVLDSLLQDTNCEQFAITNTIACFPFQKKYAGKFRLPSEIEMINCRPRLDDLIETLQPQYYIALGETAKQNPPTGVTWSLELDHPSFILRRGGVGCLDYKRNRHRLHKFLKENQ